MASRLSVFLHPCIVRILSGVRASQFALGGVGHFRTLVSGMHSEVQLADLSFKGAWVSGPKLSKLSLKP